MASHPNQAASESGRHPGSKPGMGSRLCVWAGTGVLAVAVVVCAVLVLPRMLGFVPYSIATGSMEPSMPVGSVAYVQPADDTALQAGDVVAYTAPAGFGELAGSVVVHRVVSNDKDARTIVTQGDANASPDLQPIPYGAIIGKVVLSVPVLGYGAMALSSWEGKLFALCWIVGGLALCFAGDRLRRCD